jgi:glucosamine--fructose-6-phosphate aminotransferase (isomerizing)
MCGIIGRVGSGDIVRTLIDGMKKLEYRGYDSYGFCVLKKDFHFLYKDVGTISQNTNLAGYAHILEGYISGIGHTRWATTRHIVAKLKERIGSAQINRTRSFLLIVSSVLQTLEGDNAFLVLHQNLPDRIFCATRGSKSLLVTDNGYVSSDSYAIAGAAKEAQRIKNSVACLSSKGIISSVKIFNDPIIIETIPKRQDAYELSEPHFMLQEIKEQPSLIKEGVYLEHIPPEKLNLFGCGSSYYAAMWGKIWFEKLAKIPTTVTYGSEATYTSKDPKATNIYISQSGETKDIIYATNPYKSCKDYIVTNNINSCLGSSDLQTIDIDAGPEYGVAATKTFTMTCFRLWEMAWHWADEKNRGVVDVGCAIEGLVAGIHYVLEREEAIRTLAKMLARYDNALFLGRYYDYPIALEGALKLKEVSYIHAEGMPAAEMKHGPIALVDEKTPSIFVVTADLDLEVVISNMREIKSRGGKVFAVADAVTHDRVMGVADWAFRTHNMHSLAMSPLASNVVLQLLAYHVAVERGLNPDRPRNLAKSVTV